MLIVIYTLLIILLALYILNTYVLDKPRMRANINLGVIVIILLLLYVSFRFV